MSNTDETIQRLQETNQRLQAELQLSQAQNRQLLSQTHASQSPAVDQVLDQNPNNPWPRPQHWRPIDGVVKWDLTETAAVYHRYFTKGIASGQKTGHHYSYEAIYAALSYWDDCVKALDEIIGVQSAESARDNGDAAVAALVGTAGQLKRLRATVVGVGELLRERLDGILLSVAKGQTSSAAVKALAETVDAQSGISDFAQYLSSRSYAKAAEDVKKTLQTTLTKKVAKTYEKS